MVQPPAHRNGTRQRAQARRQRQGLAGQHAFRGQVELRCVACQGVRQAQLAAPPGSQDGARARQDLLRCRQRGGGGGTLVKTDNAGQVGLGESPTAIATVLSDMDAELEALEQRRAKTAALKQGMMQELLTGRTRLV